MDDILAAIQPYLTFIKDIYTIGSLCIAAVVAIKGLQTWRRQLKGTANYELARRLLTVTYQLRDALQSSRLSQITSEEVVRAAKESQLDIKPSEIGFEAARMAVILQHQWQPALAARKALELEAFEAETLWGPDARAATLAIIKSYQDLSSARYWYSAHLRPEADNIIDRGVRKKYESILFGSVNSDEPDPFVMQLASAVREIEAVARPHLSR